jgi:hypothetical protein
MATNYKNIVPVSTKPSKEEREKLVKRARARIRRETEPATNNKREQYVKKIAESRGFEILRGGWPDFLFYKEKENRAVFVEVKDARSGPGRELRPGQQRMLQVLKKLGLNVQVVYVE